MPILRAPQTPCTLVESVSDAKTATVAFSLEIGTTHHVYKAPRSSSFGLFVETLATLFTMRQYSPFTIDHGIIAELLNVALHHS